MYSIFNINLILATLEFMSYPMYYTPKEHYFIEVNYCVRNYMLLWIVDNK